MKLGFFTMPIHPPGRNYTETLKEDRELVLVKVGVNSKTRADVMQITDIFRAKIVDVQPRNFTIEVSGNESKISKFIALMEPFGIAALTRTGKVALPRKNS